MHTSRSASMLQLIGAAGFGSLIGWLVYFVNRHREGPVHLTDIGALVGVLGGGAVLPLFPARTDLFGAFGIGLFVGFLGYFSMLLPLVKRSERFSWDWLLDGSTRTGEHTAGHAMGRPPPAGPTMDLTVEHGRSQAVVRGAGPMGD